MQYVLFAAGSGSGMSFRTGRHATAARLVKIQQ
jgi:hypothetical protein